MALPGTHFRQGDILAVAVEGLPKDVEIIPAQAGNAFALTLGGADGNSRHLVTATSVVRAFRAAGNLDIVEWIHVDEGLTVTHPQHGTLHLEPGTWRIVRQREYDPGTFERQRAD